MAIELKMIRPQIMAGVKQPHDFAAALVDGGDIASFTAIAKDARVRQIFDIRKAALLAADDVIDMRPECDIVLVYQAVFATMVRATSDLVAKRLGNFTAHWQESGAPVLWPFSGCAPTPGSGRVQPFPREKGAAPSRVGSDPPLAAAPRPRVESE